MLKSSATMPRLFTDSSSAVRNDKRMKESPQRQAIAKLLCWESSIKVAYNVYQVITPQPIAVYQGIIKGYIVVNA